MGLSFKKTWWSDDGLERESVCVREKKDNESSFNECLSLSVWVFVFSLCLCRWISPLPAPEKRQRVPSAYNRFIKWVLFFFFYHHSYSHCNCVTFIICSLSRLCFREEIQRIKAGNPDISHREAFSAAAKNVRTFIFHISTIFIG